ncbi:AraC family transcriptional regulator ligand-binding domain-containing protein [Pseudomonas guineae]|uniref:AraC family transcriptional regulator n=1 Tax=Pseudomonas guineae TaxID=425504 RepID=UPI003D080504
MDDNDHVRYPANSPVEQPGSHPAYYVVGPYIQPVLLAYMHQGGRLSALADAMAVSDLWIINPPEKIALEQYFWLLLSASRLLKDGQLGIKVGQHAGLENFDALGQALTNLRARSLTLAHALQQVMTLERLVHRLGTSRIVSEGENIRLIWRAQFQQHKAARLVCESVLAGIIHMAEQLTGRLIPVMEVCFVHPRPSDYSDLEYQQGFRAQCKFSQSHNSIMIAADVLSWPLQHIARPSVAATDSVQVVDQVKNQLKKGLMNSPKLAQIASVLGLGERGLQRQLKQRCTNYQQLLAEVRLHHAQDYLIYSNLSILQISQLLGFKEQSSFNHFFLQASGVSPKKWQEAKKSDSL